VQVIGIVSRPAEPKTIERKDGSTSIVHEMQVLDDTAGVITLQAWAKESPFPPQLRRGDRIQVAIKKVSVFGGEQRGEIDGAVTPAPKAAA
jgi:ssDNA-binding replication factor A large subunit